MLFRVTSMYMCGMEMGMPMSAMTCASAPEYFA